MPEGNTYEFGFEDVSRSRQACDLRWSDIHSPTRTVYATERRAQRNRWVCGWRDWNEKYMARTMQAQYWSMYLVCLSQLVHLRLADYDNATENLRAFAIPTAPIITFKRFPASQRLFDVSDASTNRHFSSFSIALSCHEFPLHAWRQTDVFNSS